MKKTTISLLAVLFSSNVQADAGRGLVSHIEWAQKAMSSGVRCATGENAPADAAQVNDVAILCATQICGASQDFTYFDELAVKLTQEPSARAAINQKASGAVEAINAYLDETLEMNKLVIRGYKDLKVSGDLSPAPEFARVHDLMAMLKEYRKASFQAGPDEKNILSINRAATEAQLADLPDAQRRWAVDAIDRFVSSPIGAELIRQQVQKPDEFFGKMYPGLSMSDALRADAAKVQKRASDLLNGPQSAQMRSFSGVEEFFANPVIAKAASGQELSESEVSDYMMTRYYSRMYHDVLTSKAQGGQTLLPDSANPENLPAFLQRVGFDARITQFEADLSDPFKVQELRSAVYNQCLSNLYFHMGTSPTQEQIDQARLNGDWAKTRIKEVLAGSLSDQSRGSVNSAIDQSSFAMPRSQEAFQKFFVEQLQSSLTMTRNNNRSYEGMIRSGRHREETLSAIHLNQDKYSIDQAFTDVQQFCDEFKFTFVNDNVKTSTGAIETSWVSSRMPEFGKAVMVHELGHVAHEVLGSQQASAESRGRFESVRQCLAENHPAETKEWHDQFSEELYSDLIASKGMTHPSANIGCNLIGQFHDTYQFTELINYWENETHPTAFFRALQAYKVQKGNLPSACTQYLESKGNRWNFNTCM